ncbi:hypothetical protein L7F22_025455 [Adiantum nelumboides]|nr:hypothetical protein [Adiantum nelumboides]
MPMLWSSKDDDRLVDEVRQGKGIRFRLTEETREKIRSYCVANAAVMEKWRDKYADARNNDASLPNVPSQSWILDAMLTAKSNGEVVSTEEMDYAYGCDWHIDLIKGLETSGVAIPSCNSPAFVALKTGSPQSPLLDGTGGPYDSMGMHSPLPYGALEKRVGGRKREFEGCLEKVVERRQKHMIKNRGVCYKVASLVEKGGRQKKPIGGVAMPNWGWCGWAKSYFRGKRPTEGS